jgi:hypothetical protein
VFNLCFFGGVCVYFCCGGGGACLICVFSAACVFNFCCVDGVNIFYLLN